MTEKLNVVPDDLRRAADAHREIAEQLSTACASHPAVIATLQSLGPVFADLRAVGHRLLEERRECYRQQAAAHGDLADTLCQAATVWECHDSDSARQLAGPGNAER